MALAEDPATSFKSLGTLLLLKLIRILAHCKWYLSTVSTATKPPQASPTLLKKSFLHKCTDNPIILTQISLAEAPSLKQPTSGLHQSNFKLFPLKKQHPKHNTLLASLAFSKSNKIKAPPYNSRWRFPTRLQFLLAQDFRQPNFGASLAKSPHLPTRECFFIFFSNSSHPHWMQTTSPISPLPLEIASTKEAPLQGKLVEHSLLRQASPWGNFEGMFTRTTLMLLNLLAKVFQPSTPPLPSEKIKENLFPSADKLNTAKNYPHYCFEVPT